MRRQKLKLTATVTLVVLAVAAVVAVGGASPAGRATLTIDVRGGGSVQIRPGKASCAYHCRHRVVIGAAITLIAQPSAGHHLVGWKGACLNRLQCTIRLRAAHRVLARFSADAGLVSWNPYYRRCKPVITTIPAILGSQQDSRGGATEAGGGFQPHLSGPPDQHLLDPPCSIGGRSAFVEIHDVVLAEDPERSADGDESMNMTDPSRPALGFYMKTIHTEIDHLLFEHGVAPPIPPRHGNHVDIQGFVFWDPAHTDAPWHSYSGWEIHTVTAWRPARAH